MSTKTVAVQYMKKPDRSTLSAESGVPKDFGEMIEEKERLAIGEETSRDLKEGLKNLGEINIPKIIDDAMKGKKSPELEKLEELGASFEKKKEWKSRKSTTDEASEKKS